ncbi:cupredoxin domain-containing protein [Limimaricola hongkongensis]|uniref:Copper tolerance protein n=1 Tax=Limimaricola hongkongensis DSM 17492 TaxID=1122180 RepID=A0A017HAB3_9RHOB|nr:plastocyanin/azurin family copper-binding protein [Limimaricola hongkongensis]EYD71437.1 Copper tolerance protein [Limimaricola hongkongensis DSM 17492]
MKSLITALALLPFASSALAGPGHGAAHGIGEPGDPAKVDRVVEIAMDEMSYSPASVEVAAGETIRFVVSNEGRLVHEFNLGTPDSWATHEDEMQAMMREGMMSMRRVDHEKMQEMGMAHDDPNSLLLEPGESAEIVWTFPEDGQVGYACNVPGHLEAGMKGKVALEAG